MCCILQRKSTNDYEQNVFDHVRYENFRCTSRVVCGLNTLGFYCVTIIYSSLEYSGIFCFYAVRLAFTRMLSRVSWRMNVLAWSSILSQWIVGFLLDCTDGQGDLLGSGFTTVSQKPL